MQQKITAIATLLSLSALVFWTACNKATPFGANLFDNQTADYTATDTLTLKCSVEREDKIITSDLTSTTAYFLCGELNEPIFGKSTSDIYTSLRLRSTSITAFKAPQVLDSVVLYLRYAPAGIYGDTTQAQTLVVERLAQPLDNSNTYYSDETLPVAEEVGRVNNFFPKPTTLDSLSSTAKAAFLRVPLSAAFGQELFGYDSLTYTSDSLFRAKVRGFRIKSSSASNPGAMLAFTLNDGAFSIIRLYYKDSDTTTVRKSIDYIFSGSNKFTHLAHDYAGSAVEPTLGQPANDLMYIQGVGGLRIKVEMPFADDFKNIAVNKAELVLTVANQPGDNVWLTPLQQLVSTESQGDTTFVYTSDAAQALSISTTGELGAFGGIPEAETINGTTVKRYRLNMGYKFQEIVDDAASNPKKRIFYVNVYRSGRIAGRSILYGPKSATFPAKIELKYTRIN